MGVESRDVRELFDEDDAGEALFGRRRGRKSLPYPDGTVFRVFVGCLSYEEDRLEYERLLTESYRCQNHLEKPGDLALITMQGTFDKEGSYHVAARYALLAGDAKPSDKSE